MLQLRITDEDGYEVVVPFIRDEISIGRKEGNTIRLTERNISRHHALLTREDEQLFVDDLDSYNGIILNGNRIGRKSGLYPGDILLVGDYKIRVEEAETARDRVELDPGIVAEVRKELAAIDDDFDQLDLVHETVSTPALLEAAAPQTSEAAESAKPGDSTQENVTGAKAETPQPGNDLAPSPDELASALTMMLPAVPDDEDTDATPSAAETQSLPAVDLDQPPEPLAENSHADARMVTNPTPQPPPPPPSASGSNPAIISARLATALDEEAAGLRGKGMWLITFGMIAAVLVGAVLVLRGLGSETEQAAEPGLVAVENLPGDSVIPEDEALKKADEEAKQRVTQASEERKEALKQNAEAAADREQEVRAKAISATMEEAQRLIGEESWKQAETVLNALLAEVPDAEQARSLRESVRLNKAAQSDYQKALKAFDKQEYYLTVLLLSGIDEQSAYRQRARDYLPTAQAKLVRQYAADGWKAYKQGSYPDALRQAEKALAIAPKDADALQLRTASRSKMQKAEESPKTTQAADKEPTLDAPRHYNVAINYYNKKQYADAIRHFKSAIELESKFARAWRGLGVCYALVGEMDSAMRAYEQYLKLDPKAADAAQVRKIIDDYRASKR
jgi:pSer/pThr/pTyr-binding forkhead associated (FHA) protein/tetratricopeptide (TPR) repeat protein